MKKTSILFPIIFTILLSTSIMAQNYKISLDDPQYEKIEANLLEGLKSTNDGLKFSSAFALGEMKSEMAINPLISMLRSHKDDNFRILAALSLTKIGTERCLFMVKRVGKFIENPKVATFCEKFSKYKKSDLTEEDLKVVNSLFK